MNTAGYQPWAGAYRVGRISRDDQAKFAADTRRIFDRVLVPPTLQKKVYILGYGENAAAKCGSPPAELDCLTWSPNAVATEEFYQTVSTVIHKTGGSRESYCRVVVESYAHSVVPIGERDSAFPEIIIDGETGFMAGDSDEMSIYGSLLAHDPRRHRRMPRPDAGTCARCSAQSMAAGDRGWICSDGDYVVAERAVCLPVTAGC